MYLRLNEAIRVGPTLHDGCERGGARAEKRPCADTGRRWPICKPRREASGETSPADRSRFQPPERHAHHAAGITRLLQGGHLDRLRSGLWVRTHRKIQLTFGIISWTTLLGKAFLVPADGLQLWHVTTTEVKFKTTHLFMLHPLVSFMIFPVFKIQTTNFWNVVIPFKSTLRTECWSVQMQGLKVGWQCQRRGFLSHRAWVFI
uniref:Uncharacterized protein n=1 Tax=Pipistrellus kuhlii TaxID=59472 RepID=A0A7J7VMZ6_PIPKU|nr:hypothetical protein mPipKuh1_008428 [Pipistrellus kuhlii]